METDEKQRTVGQIAADLIEEVTNNNTMGELDVDQLISLAQACALLQIATRIADHSDLVNDVRNEARLWFSDR